MPRFALLAVSAFIAGVLLFAATSLLAGVVGSPHDLGSTNLLGLYTTTNAIGRGGVCSACHIPHAVSDSARDDFLWPRSLSIYRTTLSLRDGNLTGEPNYLKFPTVHCYDCHDTHTDGVIESTSVPELIKFDPGHSTSPNRRPQDILFGFKKNGSGDMTEFSPGPQAGKITPGYYENNPPGPSGSYGINVAAPLKESGGHYYMSDPFGSTSQRPNVGDKLPCSDCHDPHAWESAGKWQAFIRKSWPSGSRVATRLTALSAVQGSSYMANPPTPDSGAYGRRDDQVSRQICISCHGDASGLPPVNFTEIRSGTDPRNAYDNGSPIRGLPTSIGEHASASTVACVSCHEHNSIGANCSQCHGFPPSTTAVPAYPATTASTFVPSPNPGAADSHPRHYGARSGEERNALPGFVYKLDCGVCHYGSALGIDSSLQQHQNARVSVVLLAGWTAVPNQTGGFPYDNTNYYNPSPGHSGAGQLDNTNASNGWGNGSRYGGNSCRNVYCHSIGRKPSSMTPGDNTHYRTDTAFTWNSGPQHCNDCHGRGTDNVANGGINWGMPNYAGGPAGSDTANSHSAHVVRERIECSVCHFTTVTGTGAGRAILASPVPSNHVDNVRQVVFDGTNATGTYTPATKTCVTSCHDGQWGATLLCASCHVRVGDVDDFGTGSQASMSNNSITAGIDNNEWNWSGHGRDTSQYDVSLNPAANLRSGGGTGTNKCAFCHDPAIAHDNASNPFRLANRNVFGQGWNGACYVCHASAAVGNSAPGYAPANDCSAVPSGTYVAKTASQKVGNNHYNPGTASNARHNDTTPYNGGAFCFDCHDPHGDRNNSGVGNILMIGKKVSMKTDNVYGIPAGGTAGAGRRDAVFTNNQTATDFVHTVAGGPYDRLCEVCHEGASGIQHYLSTGPQAPAHNASSRCTQCHTHDGGFRGLGGPDVGQYFDRAIQAPSASNYYDNSSHPLIGFAPGDNGSLRFGAQGSANCLGCHYASGPSRTSDECLMCHYENDGGNASSLVRGALGTQHMDGTIELTSITGNVLPTSQFPIGTIQQYDSWCLQCHSVTTYSLGNIFPAASRRTVIDTTDWQAGQHTVNAVGCIYCHQPHGRGNARIVRENPDNRRTAGGVPMKFGVFPADNLSGGSYGAAQNMPYRARVDNNAATGNVFADADDDTSFCNIACHQAKTNQRYAKDKKIRRAADNGIYFPAGSGIASKKIYLIQGPDASPTGYANDNIAFPQNKHVHPNGEVISTDQMVDWWKTLINLTGPSYYKYPGTGNPNPDTYGNAANLAAAQAGNLWLFPDASDGARDFPNGYAGFGRIRYRYSCSTCHNPHGTPEPNGGTGEGYPDLRMRKTNPPNLCNQCHQ